MRDLIERLKKGSDNYDMYAFAVGACGLAAWIVFAVLNLAIPRTWAFLYALNGIVSTLGKIAFYIGVFSFLAIRIAMYIKNKVPNAKAGDCCSRSCRHDYEDDCLDDTEELLIIDPDKPTPRVWPLAKCHL